MRTFLLAAALSLVLLTGCGPSVAVQAPVADELIASAYEEGRSGIQVSGSGTVARILPDDDEGGRHQRFILTLESGQTLLVAHNVDLAPRIPGLAVGDTVEFDGVYEWNDQGGVIHWTHHDPLGEHEPGWLKHEGIVYE